MASFPWQRIETVHYFGSYWVPIATLYCRGPDGRARSVGFVVDTGAIHSIVQYTVGQLLGVPYENGRRFEIRGIGGAMTEARVHILPVELDGRDLLVPVTVAENDNVPNLLGRFGVMDRISVLLDHRRKSTTLSWRLKVVS